jgi:hypothetical protein
MMHTLFTREHNAICDRLRAEYPGYSDDDLFDRARLINTALLAKIHTIEWTPALLNHPTARRGLNANWWGLVGKTVKRLVGRISDNEIISGIVGGRPDHFGVPYSLTEEFVAVYRMHPLIPDDYTFRAVANDEVLQEREFAQVAQRPAMELMDQVAMQDLFYSFGTAHPGAITLHNYPRGLQNFQRPDGIPQDLAATDIFRSRELGGRGTPGRGRSAIRARSPFPPAIQAPVCPYRSAPRVSFLSPMVVRKPDSPEVCLMHREQICVPEESCGSWDRTSVSSL